MESPKEQLKHIIVTMVLTPAAGEDGQGQRLDVQTSVSVNGKPIENVQAALVLAGDLSVGLTSNVETIGHLRALGVGTRNLAANLQDRVLDAVLDVVAPAKEPANEEGPQQEALAA